MRPEEAEEYHAALLAAARAEGTSAGAALVAVLEAHAPEVLHVYRDQWDGMGQRSTVYQGPVAVCSGAVVGCWNAGSDEPWAYPCGTTETIAGALSELLPAAL